jgi:hypothetical protein
MFMATKETMMTVSTRTATFKPRAKSGFRYRGGGSSNIHKTIKSWRQFKNYYFDVGIKIIINFL